MVDKFFALFVKPIIDEDMVDDYRREVTELFGISI